MDGTSLTLFAEELLELMDKHGLRGMVGFVTDSKVVPGCFHLTVAGEPPEFYQLMHRELAGMLFAFSGRPPVETGEVRFVPKKSNNNEMPH